MTLGHSLATAGICAASGAVGDADESHARAVAQHQRERAIRIAGIMDAIEVRFAGDGSDVRWQELEHLYFDLSDAYGAADAEARAWGE